MPAWLQRGSGAAARCRPAANSAGAGAVCAAGAALFLARSASHVSAAFSTSLPQVDRQQTVRARSPTSCSAAVSRLAEPEPGRAPHGAFGALGLAILAGGSTSAAARLAGPRRPRAARLPTESRRTAAAAAAGEAFRILVPVADDSEEIETACITDVLTRAGAAVTVASVEAELQVKMSRGLKLVADVSIKDCVGQKWDVIACPGGMPGAERLRDSEELTQLLKEQRTSGRITAAVCAAPAVVFATHGLIGDSATSYPAPQFKEKVGAGWTDAKAVVDGNVITSQGPGTSLQFALKIVEELYGKGKAEELAAQMVTQVA